MSLSSKSAPQGPATPTQKALAPEVFHARLPSRRVRGTQVRRAR